MIMRADLNWAITRIRHGDFLRPAFDVELDVAIKREDFAGDHVVLTESGCEQ